jgi:hypothetical protein
MHNNSVQDFMSRFPPPLSCPLKSTAPGL